MRQRAPVAVVVLQLLLLYGAGADDQHPNAAAAPLLKEVKEMFDHGYEGYLTYVPPVPRVSEQSGWGVFLRCIIRAVARNGVKTKRKEESLWEKMLAVF